MYTLQDSLEVNYLPDSKGTVFLCVPQWVNRYLTWNDLMLSGSRFWLIQEKNLHFITEKYKLSGKQSHKMDILIFMHPVHILVWWRWFMILIVRWENWCSLSFWAGMCSATTTKKMNYLFIKKYASKQKHKYPVFLLNKGMTAVVTHLLQKRTWKAPLWYFGSYFFYLHRQ